MKDKSDDRVGSFEHHFGPRGGNSKDIDPIFNNLNARALLGEGVLKFRFDRHISLISGLKKPVK